MTLVGWIMRLAPYGVFCLIANTFATAGARPVRCRC